MSSKVGKGQEPIPYQALLDENRALQDEVKDLKERLEEAEELKRAISEGDLDALVIPGPERELIFTLDSADHAYRVLVETMNEGTATLAFDGTILYCNHQFAKLLKMPLQTVVGSSIYRFIATENAIKFKALLKQKAGRGEINFQARGGTSLPVYLSISSLKSEGSPNAWCLVVTDLTEQKKNEEILASERLARSIIEQAAEAIAVCDTSGRITHFSNAVSRICRCDPTFQIFENLIDVQFLGGEDAGKSILPVSSALKGSSILGAEATFELEDYNNFRQKYHLLLNSGPLKNDDGKIIGCVVTLTDITERKQAEEALQETYEQIQTQSEELRTSNEELKAQSEEVREANEALHESEKRFRTLAENSPDIIVRLDRQKRHIYANPAVAGPYDRSPEEVIGKTQSELGRYSEQLTFLEKHYENVFATGKPETVEFQYTSAQGNKYYLNTKIVPEFVNDKVLSVLAVSRDIKDIKEVEAKLKDTLEKLEEKVKERTSELEEAYESLMENEARLNEAQKIAHLGNWDWNILTDESYWSDEIYRIFGLDPLQFGETYDSFLNCVHPDDREYVHNAVKKALNGELYNIDYRITSCGGEERIVHSQGEIIFDEKHTPVRMRGIVQDITERKRMEDALHQSEALLSAFLEQLPVGLGLADTQGSWLIVNRVSRRFVKSFVPSFDPENSWRWRAWGDDGRLLERSEWPSARALRGENVTPGLDFLYTFDDGREIWTHVSSVPFRNEAGEITGVISVIQDIDEQKRTKEALAKIDKIRIKEIHHRVKNNLQVISSLLSLQAETFSAFEVCHISEVVKAFIESQNRVISMALIHEELYKGDKFDTLDFAAYLRKLTADLFRSYRLGNEDLSLNLDLEQVYLGMDTTIPLGIIVNELVSNALKHAFSDGKRGEIKINLSKREIFASIDNISDPDGDCPYIDDFQYMLTVADNGKGMPEKIELQNADSLGLQLVNILVEQIDGCIELRRDQGTRFTIWFNNIEK